MRDMARLLNAPYTVTAFSVVVVSLALSGCEFRTPVAPEPQLAAPRTNSTGQGASFAMIAAGALHTCGVTFTGAAYCWGSGAGPGGSSSLAPWPVAGRLDFSAVSAGWFHTCGLTPSGDAYCWGSNLFGQLGSPTLGGSSVPVPVTGGIRFTALSTGYYHTCGLTRSGSVYCWGAINSSGSSPAKVRADLIFVSVVAGFAHSCGLTRRVPHTAGARAPTDWAVARISTRARCRLPLRAGTPS
jgi:alpha-tubulin suppressor-like RCC1 family protein